MDTTIQIVHTGERNAIVHLTGRATDAVQESDVVKVDISELLPPARRVALRKIEYAVSGGQVTLAWGADSSVPFAELEGQEDLCFERALLQNSAESGTGVTGDIVLTTRGFDIGSTYTITLHMIKKSCRPLPRTA